MRSSFEKIRAWFDTIFVILNFCRLVVFPNSIAPIFKGGRFRNHRSFELALESARARPEIKALIESRYLSPKPYDLDRLLLLPEPSLGHQFARHMREYRLDVVFYPELEKQPDDDITYLRKRGRQTHDIWHVVCGFPATHAGEMAISAFYLAQNRVPLSALLIGFGFIYVTLREPDRLEELVNVVMLGWRMGKKASPLFAVKWEEMWEWDLNQVRRHLGVEPEPSYFAPLAVVPA